MAAKRSVQISRQARLALLVMALVLLLPMALVLRNCAQSKPDRFVQPSGHGYEEIAQIGGSTMLLERGSAGSRIFNWVGSGTDAYVFEVDDAVFEPGSAAPAPDGRVRIGRFAQLMTANPALHANIVASSSIRADAGQKSLLEARAQELRKALAASGVGGNRIESTSSTRESGKEDRSVIVVTLSRRRD